MIIYTSLLWFAAGFAPLPSLIIIHPKYKDDLPLLAHERVHQEQQRRIGLFAFWWRYLTDESFRLWSEVEAYRVQIAHGANIASCARHIATAYQLDISYESAYALLENPPTKGRA